MTALGTLRTLFACARVAKRVAKRDFTDFTHIKCVCSKWRVRTSLSLSLSLHTRFSNLAVCVREVRKASQARPAPRARRHLSKPLASGPSQTPTSTVTGGAMAYGPRVSGEIASAVFQDFHNVHGVR
jgi:hypothetical protein